MSAPLHVAGSGPDRALLPATPSSGSVSQGEGETGPDTACGVETAGAPSVPGSGGSDLAPAAQPLVITVYGVPAPQGSKKGFVAGKRAIVVDDNKPRLDTWRKAIAMAALYQHPCDEPNSDDPREHRCALPLQGPLCVEVTFTLPKPVSAPKHRVTWPKGRPDIDKLVRACFDALTSSGTWKDDAQVVEVTARKVYPDEGIDALGQPGALIRIWPVAA